MTKKEKRLEKEVLFLANLGLGINTLPKMVYYLSIKCPEISEAKVRQMVWRLIDRGQLELTPVRTIEKVIK